MRLIHLAGISDSVYPAAILKIQNSDLRVRKPAGISAPAVPKRGISEDLAATPTSSFASTPEPAPESTGRWGNILHPNGR